MRAMESDGYVSYPVCPECGYEYPEEWDGQHDDLGDYEIYLCKCGCKFRVLIKTMYRLDEVLSHKEEEE